MEATKKTPATRAALLVVAALSMLLSGLFVATASQSDATPPPACPDGFVLNADGKTCIQNAVITSADNPNSCDEGLLTPDGSRCYIAARLIPQEGTTSCPTGYSPDDSLGGMCARFEPASQHDPGCADGVHGSAGECYTLVAKGPAGDYECAVGELTGTLCKIEGAAPVPGKSTCKEGTNIVIISETNCYKIVSAEVDPFDCDDYAAYQEVSGICKHIMATTLTPAAADYDCPNGGELKEVEVDDGHMKYGYCELTGEGARNCPDNTDDYYGDASECRQSVDLTPGTATCAHDHVQEGTKCYRYVAAIRDAASCPSGAYYTNNECRMRVKDSDGAPYCEDSAAALNGEHCVYTAPFNVEKADDAYKCDKGDRAVIGDQVLCFLGPSNKNVTEGPSCLAGVLSDDQKYCIVPRIDTAPAATVVATKPAFTG